MGDIATLDLDDAETRLTIDPDIENEMRNEYNKEFAKLSNSDISSNKDEKEKQEETYVHKSIFDVGSGDKNDENNENNKARMDFLSVSSSSSISSSESQSQNKIAAAASLGNKDDKNNTVKQSQNSEDDT